MEKNCYFPDDRKKDDKNDLLFFTKLKHVSYIDTIPERYKRRVYIIDKLNSKKRNVDN